MAETINCRPYLYDEYVGVFDTATVARMQVSMKWRVEHMDPMKYFRETGKHSHPSVALMARIHLAKMDNSGFTERMFSAGSGAMGKKQTRMAFDQLEKRTLLYHNRDLMTVS